MDRFDPAINYGPNDAGASALSIALVFFGVLLISWLMGALYGLVVSYFRKEHGDKWAYEQWFYSIWFNYCIIARSYRVKF